MSKQTYHQRIVAFLADGAKRTLREIYGGVARHIDPAVADKEYRRRHPAWASVPLKERVAQGKKRLIFLSLNTMHHHRGMIEVDNGADWDRGYRLTREARKKIQRKEVVA